MQINLGSTRSVITDFQERASTAADNSAMKVFLALLLVLGLCFCSAASHAKDYSDQANECSHKIRQLLRGPLSSAPDFATIHDATKWLGEHLPEELKGRFIEAGLMMSRSLRDWEQHGMIHGPFWNIQALRELLAAQSNHFDGVAGCSLHDDLGVTREIVQDQLYIAMDLKEKSVQKSLAQLGVSDPYYAKLVLLYGVMLDFAKVTWKDNEIAQVAKFRLEPPGETR